MLFLRSRSRSSRRAAARRRSLRLDHRRTDSWRLPNTGLIFPNYPQPSRASARETRASVGMPQPSNPEAPNHLEDLVERGRQTGTSTTLSGTHEPLIAPRSVIVRQGWRRSGFALARDVATTRPTGKRLAGASRARSLLGDLDHARYALRPLGQPCLLRHRLGRDRVGDEARCHLRLPTPASTGA